MVAMDTTWLMATSRAILLELAPELVFEFSGSICEGRWEQGRDLARCVLYPQG